MRVCWIMVAGTLLWGVPALAGDTGLSDSGTVDTFQLADTDPGDTDADTDTDGVDTDGVDTDGVDTDGVDSDTDAVDTEIDTDTVVDSDTDTTSSGVYQTASEAAGESGGPACATGPAVAGWLVLGIAGGLVRRRHSFL